MGFLLVDKPVGFTSHDIIMKLRKILKTKKIGHAGTLDPFATGLLLIGIHEGTKALQFLEPFSKEYVATLKLGIKTVSGDLMDKIVEEQKVPVLHTSKIIETLQSFLGTSMQLPPMHSAIRVQGQRLYDLARNGVEIEREEREIHIEEIELLSYDESEHILVFRVICSKGTYVRTLGENIAERLGTIGHLTALRRTKIGPYLVDNAYQLEELSEDTKQISLLEGLAFLPKYVASDDDSVKHIINGQTLSYESEEDLLLAISRQEEVLAVMEKCDKNRYKVKRGLLS